ncbi:MAG: hypothetical protein CM15mP64_4620 [Candidatus Neomarinimicrobiota bacterium]|nr:MAG: hypothetical protein CM15mP64_4620 [Candidatus Neomarinimicrobiota bacterium]
MVINYLRMASFQRYYLGNRDSAQWIAPNKVVFIRSLEGFGGLGHQM